MLHARAVLCIALGVFGLGTAQAATYAEDFNAPFPAWESGWFGANSDANNYYCVGRPCSDRGNNPDGLWLAGANGSTIDVNFLGSFGDGLTSLSIDVAGYAATNLTAYDKNNVLIFSTPVTLTAGAYSNPGVYSNYVITSSTGISHFSFDGAAAGNTSIDNLVAITTAVPEPESIALLAGGLALVGWKVRRDRVQRAA